MKRSFLSSIYKEIEFYLCTGNVAQEVSRSTMKVGYNQCIGWDKILKNREEKKGNRNKLIKYRRKQAEIT